MTTAAPSIRAMAPDTAAATKSEALYIGISELTIEALIGVNPEEIGTQQPLIIDVSLKIDAVLSDTLEATIDYRTVANIAEQLGRGQIGLIETFAHKLGAACQEFTEVMAGEIRVRKPQAIPNGVAETRFSWRRYTV